MCVACTLIRANPIAQNTITNRTMHVKNALLDFRYD